MSYKPCTYYLFALFVLFVDLFFPTSTWQLRKRSGTSSRHRLLEALHPYSMAMKHDVNRCLGMKDVKDVKDVKAVWCIWLKGGFSMMYHDFIAVSSGFQYVFICFQGLNCFFLWCLLMVVATLEVAIQVLVSLKMSHLWKSDVNPSCKFVCRTTNGRVSVSLPASWLFEKLGKNMVDIFGKIPSMTGNFRGVRTVYIQYRTFLQGTFRNRWLSIWRFSSKLLKIRKDTIRAIRYQKIPTFHRILPTFFGVFPRVHGILFGEVGLWLGKLKPRRRLGVARAAICLSLLGPWPRAGRTEQKQPSQ